MTHRLYKEARLLPAIALAAVTLTLTACGGGGGGSSSDSSLQLSGTVAIGKALAAAKVSATCVSASGSTVADAQGNYSLSLANGSFPCLLEAKSADGNTLLHSAVTEPSTTASAERCANGGESKTTPLCTSALTGRSAIVNITPLTELIVQQWLGAASTPAAAFTAPTLANLTTANLNQAKDSVAAALKKANAALDLSSFDPLATAFKASTDTTKGDAIDASLDALMKAIVSDSQSSLAEVANVLVTAGDGSTRRLADLMGKPAIASCASARSGKYLIVSTRGAYGSLTVDLSTLTAQLQMTAILADGSSGSETVRNYTLAVDSSKSCAFHATDSDNTTSNLAFADSDTVVWVGGDVIAMALPRQNLSLAALAGDWNVLEYRLAATTVNAVDLDVGATNRHVFRVDTTGQVACQSSSQSDEWCAQSQWALQSDSLSGGYLASSVNRADTQANRRLFAFRTPTGDVALAMVGAKSLAIASRQIKTALPDDGSHWSRLAAQLVGRLANAAYSATTSPRAVFASSEYTNRLVDAVSYRRLFTRQNDTVANFIDSVVVNNPQDGLGFRPAFTSEGVSGSDLITMTLPGTQLAVFADSGGLAKVKTGGASIFGLAVTRKIK